MSSDGERNHARETRRSETALHSITQRVPGSDSVQRLAARYDIRLDEVAIGGGQTAAALLVLFALSNPALAQSGCANALGDLIGQTQAVVVNNGLAILGVAVVGGVVLKIIPGLARLGNKVLGAILVGIVALAGIYAFMNIGLGATPISPGNSCGQILGDSSSNQEETILLLFGATGTSARKWLKNRR